MCHAGRKCFKLFYHACITCPCYLTDTEIAVSLTALGDASSSKVSGERPGLFFSQSEKLSACQSFYKFTGVFQWTLVF